MKYNIICHLTACGAGTYSSLTDTSCQACPASTSVDEIASSECACLPGFYRNDFPLEGPETGCSSEDCYY